MIIHHIYANQSNVGDWMSAQAIQELLGASRINEYFCDAPFVPSTMERLASVAPDDLVVIGGGGLFSSYFQPFWERFAALPLCAPYVIWGVGCCDRKRQPSLLRHDLIAPIVQRSRWCVVRDDLTRRYLNLPSLPPAVPCPSIVAAHEHPKSTGGGLLHVDHYDNIGEENFALITRETERFAAQQGVPCRQTNNLISAGRVTDLHRIQALYQQAGWVVSSRLHGCILGLATGGKVLAISGDWKVESFMQAAGLQEWVCDLNEMDRLPEMLEKLPAQPSSAEFIHHVRQTNQEIAATLKRELLH